MESVQLDGMSFPGCAMAVVDVASQTIRISVLSNIISDIRIKGCTTQECTHERMYE